MKEEKEGREKETREERMEEGTKVNKYTFFLYNTVYQLYLNFKNTLFFLENNFLTFSHMLNRVCDSRKKKVGMIGLQLQGLPHYLLRLLFVSQPDPDYIPEEVIMVCQGPIIMSQHLKSLSLYFYSFREFLLSAQLRVSLLQLYI